MKRRMNGGISKYFYVGSKYRTEFRKQMRTFIVFTLGFTIAFSWRETIFDGSKKIVKWLTGTNKSGSFGASIFITLVSVLLIFLTAQWLKDKHPAH